MTVGREKAAGAQQAVVLLPLNFSHTLKSNSLYSILISGRDIINKLSAAKASKAIIKNVIPKLINTHNK